MIFYRPLGPHKHWVTPLNTTIVVFPKFPSNEDYERVEALFVLLVDCLQCTIPPTRKYGSSRSCSHLLYPIFLSDRKPCLPSENTSGQFLNAEWFHLPAHKKGMRHFLLSQDILSVVSLNFTDAFILELVL